MENGIGSQLLELNPVEEEERMEKFVGRERKPAIQKAANISVKPFGGLGREAEPG
jgi:hypothetical protein